MPLPMDRTFATTKRTAQSRHSRSKYMRKRPVPRPDSHKQDHSGTARTKSKTENRHSHFRRYFLDYREDEEVQIIHTETPGNSSHILLDFTTLPTQHDTCVTFKFIVPYAGHPYTPRNDNTNINHGSTTCVCTPTAQTITSSVLAL